MTMRGSNDEPPSVPSRVVLPSARQLEETLDDFEQLWQRVVPRSARPTNKGIYERIRRQLTRMLEYAEHHATQMAASTVRDALAEEDAPEEMPLVLVMRVVRTLSPEQWEQVKILMQLRELSDEARAELFEELDESHHVDCGMEVDPDDPHDDCPAAMNVEEEESGEADDPAGTSLPLAQTPGANGPSDVP